MSMQSLVSTGATLINGQPGEQLSAADRGLQYGDGLFETISCVEGRPRWLPLHLQRLQRGCERLQLRFRAFAALEEEIYALASAQPRCLVKVIVTRGTAVRRGYRPSGQELPTRIVSRHEWPEDPEGPVRLALSGVSWGSNTRLAGIKHLNRLEQVLAQLDRADGVDEVLMLSSEGRVISGSMSNVFFADDHGLFTPDLHHCGVEGVMRRRVLEILGSSQTAAGGPRTISTANGGAAVRVRDIDPKELANVQEAFVTNVRWGVRSVAELAGRALPSDDYAQRLRPRLAAAGM